MIPRLPILQLHELAFFTEYHLAVSLPIRHKQHRRPCRHIGRLKFCFADGADRAGGDYARSCPGRRDGVDA